MKQGFVLANLAVICAALLVASPVIAADYGMHQFKKLPAPKNTDVSPLDMTNFSYDSRASVGPFYQSHQNTFGLFDLFVPYTFNPHSILFADGRLVWRGVSSEYNVGFGMRNITSSSKYLWTLYSFYDYRITRFGNGFNQITVGADFQTEKWYVNANGYIPVGKSTGYVDQFNTAYLCNDNTRICYARGIEKSMNGVDFEVGRDFTRDFTAYVGGYYFFRSGVTTAAGPKIRLQYNIQHQDQSRVFYIFEKIALLVDWRDDNLVGSSWYAGARFDFSIGPPQHYYGLERKMRSYVKRDINVEMSSDGTSNNATLTEPIRILRNTFDDQETQVALTTSGSIVADAATARNNIIGVVGTLTPGADILPSTNQVLEGGEYSFIRQDTEFKVQIGNAGHLEMGANSIDVASAAAVGQNVTIENLQINSTAAIGAIATKTSAANSIGALQVLNNTANGTGNFVVLAPTGGTADSVAIEDNVISNAGTAPISITGDTGGGSLSATVSYNTITTAGAAADRGIAIIGAAGTTTVAMTNNTVTTQGTGTNAAVSLVGTAGSITVSGNFSNNTLTDSAATGRALFAIDNVTFSGNISENVLKGTTVGTGGVLSLQADAAGATLTVSGHIRLNTITDLSAAGADRIVALNDSTAGNANKRITITGGFRDNSLISSGGTAGGLYTETTNATDNVTIGTRFDNNSFSNTGAAAGILLNDTAASLGTTTVTIGKGGAGTHAALASANGLAAAAVPVTGNGTVTINP